MKPRRLEAADWVKKDAMAGLKATGRKSYRLYETDRLEQGANGIMAIKIMLRH